MDLISVIIINWNNASYLERCINSVLNQTYKNLEIIFIDNASQDGSVDLVKTLFYDQVNIVKNKENLGYSKGANIGIQNTKGKYVLIMNPDIILETNFLSELYYYSEQNYNIGGINGKYLKYDFQNNCKLDVIDSTGIVMHRTKRCLDRGQGEKDTGQYENIETIFGVCGAAAFYRREALENIKIADEYFDEDFFAYKEDIDLSWRLNLVGYKCIYLPSAICYHGRGFGGSKGGIKKYISNRKSQADFLKQLSYRNHHLMLIKNITPSIYIKDFFHIWVWIILYFIYSVILEKNNIKMIKEIIKMKHEMKEKNSVIKKKISYKKEFKETICK